MAISDVFDVPPDVAPILETDADGRLFYDGERTGFSRLDRSYIAVAGQAFADNRDVALVYPSPPTHVQIPVLLAVGFQVRSDPPALYVSNRSGIRDQYFNLGLGPKYVPDDTIEPDPLGDFTAPMVKTGDGESLSYITHHKPNHWDPEEPDTTALVHTTFGKRVASTLSEDLPLSGFVLDFTTGLLDDRDTQEAYEYHAAERDVPRVMIFDSPNHPYLEELERQNDQGESDVLFWGWSASELENGPPELLDPVADVTPTADGTTAPDGGRVPSPFVDSVNSLTNLREGITRSVIEVPHGDLESVAKSTYKRIGELARFPETTSDEYSAASRDAITSAYFLYMYLDTLTLSVEFHDSLSALDDTTTWGTSNTLQGKIDRLRSRTSILDDDVLGSGPVLDDVCDLFDKMVKALTVHNPKADAVVEEIRALRQEGREVTVFTATRNQEALLRSFVGEKTEFGGGEELTEHIHFQSLYNPHTVPAADVAIFPGVPTRSHYPAVQNGAAPEQRFVSYSWEEERLRNRLEEIVEIGEWRAGSPVQHYTANELELTTDGLTEFVDLEEARRPTRRTSASRAASASDRSPIDESASRRSEARSLPESERVGSSPTLTEDELTIDIGELAPDQSTSLDEADWEAEREYDHGDARETIDEGRTTPTDIESGGDGTGPVQAIKIEFVDGTYMYEEPRGLVWALDSDSDATSVRRERRAAASLEAGDQLLMINDDSRRDVFEHVVEKIHSECRGPFQQYLMMLDLWNTGLDHIVDYFREMEELMNENPTEPDFDMHLSDMGRIIADELTEYEEEHDETEVDREPGTVRQWLERDTLGPSSPAPIRALGELYEVEVLQNHSREIFSGLEEVRTLHQRVGQKLGKILFSTRSADADEWLLEECGLRVGDVQDATVVKRIDRISDDRREVHRSRVGKLQQP